MRKILWLIAVLVLSLAAAAQSDDEFVRAHAIEACQDANDPAAPHARSARKRGLEN